VDVEKRTSGPWIGLLRGAVLAALVGALVAPCGRADIEVTGSPSLTISTAEAGSDPDAAVDESSTLTWSNLNAATTQKIVAQTSVVAVVYPLRLTALVQVADEGDSAGDVLLSTVPEDLVVNIPAFSADAGWAVLRYEATAQASDGAGVEAHTVTFTVIDQ